MARQPGTGLFGRIQERVLALMLLRPKHEWYRSELARELGVSPSSLQRPLASLVSAGLVTARADGNRLYYAVDPDHPALPELKGLLAKTSGIAGVLRKAFSRVAGRIRCAFVYGSVASGTEVGSSDIDLLVVGDVGLGDLAPALRKAARVIGREINPTVYRTTEFREKVRGRNTFVRGVLNKPKLFVIGTASDLEEVARG